MPNSKNTTRGEVGPSAERDPISAVKLTAELTARVDAWARDRHVSRAEALERLVELGLKTKSAAGVLRPEASAIEALAESEVDQLIDPATSKEERARRIHRLTEGPPEFVGLRIDLPRRD